MRGLDLGAPSGPAARGDAVLEIADCAPCRSWRHPSRLKEASPDRGPLRRSSGRELRGRGTNRDGDAAEARPRRPRPHRGQDCRASRTRCCSFADASDRRVSWLSYRSAATRCRRVLRSLEAGVRGARAVSSDEWRRPASARVDGVVRAILLEQLKATPGTWNASLLDSGRRVVYDGRAAELGGQPSPLDTTARPALERALAGLPTTSRLFRHGGRTLAAGLAPVTDPSGRVIAVLAVEAPPSYLPLLEEFRRNLLVVTAILLVVLGAFVVVRTRFERRSAALERRLSRAENSPRWPPTAPLVRDQNPLAIIRGSAQRLGKLGPRPAHGHFVVKESDRLAATVAATSTSRARTPGVRSVRPLRRHRRRGGRARRHRRPAPGRARGAARASWSAAGRPRPAPGRSTTRA